jgi:hypothetical protein
MEIVKRTIKAIIYALVGGFSGGIGAVVGIAPINFVAGIYFGIIMGGLAGLASVAIIFFSIIGVYSNKEILELILFSVTVFLKSSLSWVAVFFILCFPKYAVRGAVMGMVRGARGGVLGGRLGGTISGMAEGTLYGFGLGAIVCGVIKLFFKFFKKNKESFYGEYFWWVILIFTLSFALLGLIIGASNGAEKYASKSIQRDDSLKSIYQSTFRYALRSVRLDDQGKIRTVRRVKASCDMIFFSPLKFRSSRDKRCDDPGDEK